jgi:CO/xanthine dehydrogenase Mo-binding subunit
MAMAEMSTSSIGTSPARLDARDKVRGLALYLDDLELPGMLYGRVLRSPVAHGRLVHVDTARARRLIGVRAVVTGAELPFLHGESLVDEPFLARDRVRYKGEAVAAVAAVDEETADEALDLIRVEYEELPAVFDPVEAAQPEAPLLHPELGSYRHAPLIQPVPGTNICNHLVVRKGDVLQGFGEADEIFEDTFTTQTQAHACLETHGAICLVTPDDELTLWATNDSPYRCRREVATALGLPLHRVRVVTPPYLGGNFGAKGGLKAEAAAIALAWVLRGRPIKVVYDREEEFTSSLVRHASVTRIKTGVKRDGRIVARQVTTYWDTGAYAEKGPTVSRLGGMSAAGPYDIPHVWLDGYAVYTNKPVAGAFRGYGGPQTAWAYESQMDLIAQRLGIDPLEIRLRNVFRDGSTHPGGQRLSGVSLSACLAKVAERLDWGKPAGPYRGKGLAFGERAIKTPFASSAFVKINEDGTVDVLSSTSEVGQGAETVLCQIAAEELGVPLASVRKASPDTAVTPFDESSTSSRSTFHMGNAVRLAAQDARRQLMAIAAELFERPVDELEVRDGLVGVVGDPSTTMPIGQVLRRRYGASATILGRGFFYPDGLVAPGDYFSLTSVFWMYAAQGAEVEVDPETGRVTVLRVVAAHDVGRAVHPESCRAQIEGAVAQGVGFALYEALEIEDGTVLNPSFQAYKIPTVRDVPPVEAHLVELPHPQGPFGAKSVGEPALVPTAAAIGNAIANAIGVRIADLPITPEKILAALAAKRRAATEAAGVR